ncbi:ketoacyl-ACP synthase III [Arenicella sp. 4NH20-0111]|uniref:ketoacyl-ACP synthase III n=1 Tax=Arenicella sp. 4NH20-0111 TaxID=3127648 RepID=UPI00310BD002
MNEINYKLLQQVHQLKPFIRTKVIGVGAYLPSQRVSSKDIMIEIGTEAKYGLPHDWMSDQMGIHERRMVAMDQTPSDLAIKASQDALAHCPDVKASDIDAVIFCGIERDLPEPATAHIIQHALGLQANHVFDVANACFGFFDGLKLASSLIESGAVKYALIVTGEVTTKMSRQVADQLKRGVSADEAKHLWGMLSVGDAGGAMVVGQSDNGHSGFMKFHQASESKHSNLCHYRWKPNGDVDAHMNMAQIVARGLKLNKKIFKETLDELGWSKVDWVIAHQTGKTAFEHARSLHGVTRQNIVKTFPKLGNITTATLPVSFQKLMASGSLKTGDRIGGLFAGSGLVAGQFGYVV